jgi:hypothetical protein
VAEFVEVGGADFPGEDGGIAFGEVPEVVQIQDGARGRVGGGAELGGQAGAGGRWRLDEGLLRLGFEGFRPASVQG